MTRTRIYTYIYIVREASLHLSARNKRPSELKHATARIPRKLELQGRVKR